MLIKNAIVSASLAVAMAASSLVLPSAAQANERSAHWGHHWHHRHHCKVVWKKRVVWRHGHRQVVRWKERVCW